MTPRMPHQYRRRSGSDVVSSTGRCPEYSLLPGVTTASSCAFQYCSDAATAPPARRRRPVEHGERASRLVADGVARSRSAPRRRRRHPAPPSRRRRGPCRRRRPRTPRMSARPRSGARSPAHRRPARSTPSRRRRRTRCARSVDGCLVLRVRRLGVVPRLGACDPRAASESMTSTERSLRAGVAHPHVDRDRGLPRHAPPSWSQAPGPAARHGARPGPDATRA